MIPGIDVSHWQGKIDWARVAQSGVKFAFIKATEFPLKRITVYIDTNLKENMDGAAKNGILYGMYHFYRTHIDPVIQAQVFYEAVGGFPSLPPVLDLEVAGKKGTILNEQISAFMKEIQRLTKRRPILYTSGGFWRSYMMYNRRTDTDWATAYPLWQAQYTTTLPSQIYPWVSWDLWQYSDKGRIPGIPGSVDLNWYIGSLEEMKNNFISDKWEKQTDLSDSLMRVEDEPKKFEGGKPAENQISNFFENDDDNDDWIKRYFFDKKGEN